MKRYGSRKFIVTMTCVVLAAVLSAFGLLTAQLAGVLSTAIIAYNGANSYLESKRSERVEEEDLDMNEIRK